MITHLYQTSITYVDQALRTHSAVRAAFNRGDPKFIQTHVVDGRVVLTLPESWGTTSPNGMGNGRILNG